MSKTHPEQSTASAEKVAQKLNKSDTDWRTELKREQYFVLRYCINGVALKFRPDDG